MLTRRTRILAYQPAGARYSASESLSSKGGTTTSSSPVLRSSICMERVITFVKVIIQSVNSAGNQYDCGSVESLVLIDIGARYSNCSMNWDCRWVDLEYVCWQDFYKRAWEWLANPKILLVENVACTPISNPLYGENCTQTAPNPIQHEEE